MSPLGPLLTYMVFGLPDSAEKWSRRFPFGLIESGGEAGPRGEKSVATG
jgi:hypothetical protein